MSIPGPVSAPSLVAAQTNHLPPRDRFSYWNDVICRTVVDLDCRLHKHPQTAPHPAAQPLAALPQFEASISGFDAPGLGAYHIHTQPHLVYRAAPEIARLDSDALVINFVTSGSLYAEQDGRHVLVQPGDGAISDAARPYFLRFDQRLGCVSVKVNKAELRQRVAGVERITAQSLAQGSTLNPLVYGYLRKLLQQVPAMDGAAALQAAEIFKELLSASLGEMLRRSPVPMSEYRAVALLRVKAFVDQHLARPELDSAFVAQGLKLSVRYINALFQAENSSLARHIWQRRLARCAAQLREPGLAHVAISVVALAQGFNNLSHFSRAFRARYGMSAREYRTLDAKD